MKISISDIGNLYKFPHNLDAELSQEESEDVLFKEVRSLVLWSFCFSVLQ